MAKPHAEVIGHRVNSVGVFERFMVAGVAGVEFDVQAVRDGTLVLYHNNKVGQQHVSDMLLDDVLALPNPDDAGAATITLDAFFAFAAAAGLPEGFKFFMELKGEQSGVATSALKAHMDHGLNAACLIILSFSPLHLKETEQLRQALPEVYGGVKTGFNIGMEQHKGRNSFPSEVHVHDVAGCADVLKEHDISPDVVSVDHRLLEAPGSVDVLRRISPTAQVATWTVDDPQAAKAVASQGVDTIITNEAAAVRAALE